MSTHQFVKLIRGRTYVKAVDLLKHASISEYQIHLITHAERCEKWTTRRDAWAISVHLDHMYPIDAIVNLRAHGLVEMDAVNGRYFLTRGGEEVREALLVCDGQATQPAISGDVANTESLATGSQIALIEQKTDVNLGRDGLMSTVSKLWYIWTHGEEIQRARLARQVESMVRGEKTIEEAMRHIASSEQRVAQELARQPKAEPREGYWTLEDQRRINDVYWGSDTTAFWLNPNMYLGSDINWNAPALTAPEWWTPSEVKPLVLDTSAADLIQQSLLAPPIEVESRTAQTDVQSTPEVSGLPDISQNKTFIQICKSINDVSGADLAIGAQDDMTILGIDSLDGLEIIMNLEEHYKIKITDDEMDALLTVRDLKDLISSKLEAKEKARQDDAARRQLRGKFLLFGYRQDIDQYRAFETDEAASSWYQWDKTPKTIARRGSKTYEQLLRGFYEQSQTSKNQEELKTVIDEFIQALEDMPPVAKKTDKKATSYKGQGVLFETRRDAEIWMLNHEKARALRNEMGIRSDESFLKYQHDQERRDRELAAEENRKSNKLALEAMVRPKGTSDKMARALGSRGVTGPQGVQGVSGPRREGESRGPRREGQNRGPRAPGK